MSAYITVNVVSDNVQEIALLVGQPFTEQLLIMIISAPNELHMKKIVLEEAANYTDKTPMWAKETLLIPKNHV